MNTTAGWNVPAALTGIFRYRKHAGALAVGILVVAVLMRAQSSVAEPGQVATVSPDEAKVVEELIRTDQRILFDALVTGDYSLFPTIYYNDPTITMHPDYQLSLSRFGDEARAAQATLDNGPKGADTGYLTARIASLLYGEEHTAAWQAIQDRAAAEGRQPSVNDLSDGVVPMERVTADQWVESEYFVHDVKISDDHATAKLAFGPPEAGGQILSYVFIRVDGTWYISYMESSWSQGDPDYQSGTPVPTIVAPADTP